MNRDEIRRLQEMGFEVIVENSNQKPVKPTKLDESEENCLNCDSCKILSDPDPDDWFCDDDSKMLCVLANRTIESSLRPFEVTGHKGVPEWCPKKPKI